MSKNEEASSYDLFYGYSYLNLSKSCFTRILKSNNKIPFMKQLIRNQLIKIDYVINNLKTYLSPSEIKTMEKGMLNEDMGLRLDNIRNMLLDLPEEKQEEIENYIEEQHRKHKVEYKLLD